MADAELISEAFNVATETGLTPRQLAEQRAELLEALKNLLTGALDIRGIEFESYCRKEVAAAEQAIANATAHQSHNPE
jgi:5'-3' exonuclease